MSEAHGAPSAEATLDNQAILTGPDVAFQDAPEEGSFRIPRFSEEGGFTPDSLEETTEASPTFGERARSFFNGMSEKGKAVAGKMYENIYKIPGVQRLAGKMEIAAHQYFIDRHEGGAMKLREKAQNLSPQIEAFRLAASETNAAIETLRQMGAPGLAGLEKKALDMDQKTMDLLLEQESLNQKADGKVDRMEQFKSRRDQVADRLIGIYAEKMSPIEKRLQSLDNNQHHIETQAAITRAEHEQQLKTLSGIEAKRDVIVGHLTAAGLSEKNIARHEVIKLLDKQIAAGREKINAEDQKIATSLARIQGGIVTANNRMSEYRMKQKEFENLKRGTLTGEQLGVTTAEETSTEAPATPEVAAEEAPMTPEPYDLDATLPPLDAGPAYAAQGSEETPSNETGEADPSNVDETPGAPEEAEETTEETLKKLTKYLEDSPHSNLTKEKKAERLKELMDSDPDIHEFFQNIFDEQLSESEQDRFAEILSKTRYSFKEGMNGFDIRLPGNNENKLIIERTQGNVIGARIIRASN